MKSATIFHPVLALVLLTAIVWMAMLIRRASRMRSAGIQPQDMPTRALADLKFGDAQIPNNNLMNLFELPVLFYVSSILVFVLSLADGTYVTLGWIYVAFRAIQSAIALTYNSVLQRGIAYLLSCVVLWAIWARLAYQIAAA